MDTTDEDNVAALTLCELLTAEKVPPLDMLDENVYFAPPSVNDHDMTFHPDTFETFAAPEVEISQEQPTVESIEPVQLNTENGQSCYEHGYASASKKHHRGKMDISFKDHDKKRAVSVCKRRPTLLKKAFELHSISDADVFCLVQNKNGDRWFYGSGNLKDKFCTEGLKSLESDQEFSVSQKPDRSVVVEPSPSKPNNSQSYLPSTLRNLKPTLTTEESQDAQEPSVKTRGTQRELFKTPKSKVSAKKKSEANKQTEKCYRKGKQSTAATAKRKKVIKRV